MKTQEEIKKIVPYVKMVFPGTYGSEITVGTHKGSVIWSANEEGWEHVSFSPYNHSYIPHWKDMCELKAMFWPDEEECIQFFPKKSEYVNIQNNCLHIWRNTKMAVPGEVV